MTEKLEVEELEVGGLRFEASFRSPSGATMRVSGPVAGEQKELLRFDDFVDSPHYHAPSEGPSIMFDRAELGEPLDWFVGQVRDDLEEWLTSAGFTEILPLVDLTAVSQSAERIRQLMVDVLPDGYVRVPGVGLQRVGG